jgi:hypothetical protein
MGPGRSRNHRVHQNRATLVTLTRRPPRRRFPARPRNGRECDNRSSPDGLGILLRFVAGQRLQLDFGVSFTPKDAAASRAIYNYGTAILKSQDMFGASGLKDCSCAAANTAETVREFALTRHLTPSINLWT